VNRLNPTYARQQLLQAVADGKVCRYGDHKTYLEAHRDVTYQVGLAEEAGWVVLGEQVFPGKTRWQLTDAGRQILEAAS
jgi:hypothetical protein